MKELKLTFKILKTILVLFFFSACVSQGGKTDKIEVHDNEISPENSSRLNTNNQSSFTFRNKYQVNSDHQDDQEQTTNNNSYTQPSNNQTFSTGQSVTGAQENNPSNNHYISPEEYLANYYGDKYKGSTGSRHSNSSDQQTINSSCGGLLHGQSETVTGYTSPRVSHGQTCQKTSILVSCNNGNLIKPSINIYPNCLVDEPSYSGCGELTHGQSQTFYAYMQPSVPYGRTCQKSAFERTCNNGNLIMPPMMTYSQCFVEKAPTADNPSSSKNQGCGDLKHGESKTLSGYASPSVPYGQSCKRTTTQSTCINGQLNTPLIQLFSNCIVLSNPNINQASAENHSDEVTADADGFLSSIDLHGPLKSSEIPLKVEAINGYTSIELFKKARKAIDNIYKYYPYKPGARTNISDVSQSSVYVGSSESKVKGNLCYIDQQGALYCAHHFGYVGDGTTQSDGRFVKVFSSGATQVISNFNATCAVVSSALYCWGGQKNNPNVSPRWFYKTPVIGAGSTLFSTTPIKIINSGVKKITFSSYYGCAVTNQGALKCWGKYFADSPKTIYSSGVKDVYVGIKRVCVDHNNQLKCFKKGDTQSTIIAYTNTSEISKISISDTHICLVRNGALLCDYTKGPIVNTYSKIALDRGEFSEFSYFIPSHELSLVSNYETGVKDVFTTDYGFTHVIHTDGRVSIFSDGGQKIYFVQGTDIQMYQNRTKRYLPSSFILHPKGFIKRRNEGKTRVCLVSQNSKSLICPESNSGHFPNTHSINAKTFNFDKPFKAIGFGY
ncbi:MAG: hypothetical protein ACPGJV_12560 [Bacteriovoracaceae bacterium]